MRLASFVAAALLAAAAPALAQTAAAPRGPERFAPEIAAFAAADKAQPPAPCGFLFVGSSSIRFWSSLRQDMAPLPVINRGFGGSEIADVDFYFDQTVRPYRPRAIVFYAGENDIAAGKSPDQVTADFTRFLDLKSRALGSTPVYFISLKPSKLRFAQLDRQAQVNANVEAMTRRRSDLFYIDVVAAMLKDGQPRDIYRPDQLHMTPDGYAIWTKIIRPVIEAEARRPTSCRPR